MEEKNDKPNLAGVIEIQIAPREIEEINDRVELMIEMDLISRDKKEKIFKKLLREYVMSKKENYV